MSTSNQTNQNNFVIC